MFRLFCWAIYVVCWIAAIVLAIANLGFAGAASWWLIAALFLMPVIFAIVVMVVCFVFVAIAAVTFQRRGRW